MSRISIPGWVWPGVILALQQLIDYYSQLDSLEAGAVVIVLGAVIKAVEMYLRKSTEEVVVERQVVYRDKPPEGTRASSSPQTTRMVEQKPIRKSDRVIEWFLG